MKRMSFSKTIIPMRAARKWVTTRIGWRNLKPGDRVLAIEKGMGLAKGERQVEIGEIEIISAQPATLADRPESDAMAEGFPGWPWSRFVARYCAAFRCNPQSAPTRIEFRPLYKPCPMARERMKTWTPSL